MNIFKRIELYVSAIFKLGKTERLAKTANWRISQLEEKIERYSHQFEEHQKYAKPAIAELIRGYSELLGRNGELARGYTDLTRRIDRLFEYDLPILQGSKGGGDSQGSHMQITSGFEALQQSFYHRLENEYRGSLKDIRKKLSVYLPDIEAAFLRTGEKPVLDLGCGRGEWLELLQAYNIPALGVDTNSHQIEEVFAAGHNVKRADAIQTLKDADSGSYAAITAFHLIEHLPFETVLWMVRESLRVLSPGGVLLFETPNVRNILVGATSFHNDPTHLKPFTDPILKVLFETCGYDGIDIRLLNPHERLNEFCQRHQFDEELAYLMFGPQDVAILGRKPLETN